jgi:hypothetical protein
LALADNTVLGGIDDTWDVASSERVIEIGNRREGYR